MEDAGTLAKGIFYDNVCQLQVPSDISLLYSANCYDSVAHSIASMVFQDFGFPEE